MPEGHDLPDIVTVLPTLFGYLLSFVFVGIYWNNHHHMLRAVHKVNGRILWRTCTCSSGCRSCRSRPRGWGTAACTAGRSRSTVSCCSCPVSPTGCSRSRSSRVTATTPSSRRRSATRPGYASLGAYTLGIVFAFFQPVARARAVRARRDHVARARPPHRAHARGVVEMTFEVVLLEHREPALAARVAQLQREAYAVEAAWLGVKDFPPMRITAGTSPRSGAACVRRGARRRAARHDHPRAAPRGARSSWARSR